MMTLIKEFMILKLFEYLDMRELFKCFVNLNFFIRCALVLCLSEQDDGVALHGPHRTPHSLVPGALSAAVTSLCQGRGHDVRHCTFNRQQEVRTPCFVF